MQYNPVIKWLEVMTIEKERLEAEVSDLEEEINNLKESIENLKEEEPLAILEYDLKTVRLAFDLLDELKGDYIHLEEAEEGLDTIKNEIEIKMEG